MKVKNYFKKIMFFFVIVLTAVVCIDNVYAISKIDVTEDEGTKSPVGSITTRDSGDSVPASLDSTIQRNIISASEETGELIVELRFGNSKSSEIFFVIDDNKNQTNEILLLQINAVRDIINYLLPDFNNIKIGIISTKSQIFVNLTTDKEDLLEGLTSIENNTATNSANLLTIYDSLDEHFSTNADIKKIVLMTAKNGEEDTIGNYYDEFLALEYSDEYDLRIFSFYVGYLIESDLETQNLVISANQINACATCNQYTFASHEAFSVPFWFLHHFIYQIPLDKKDVTVYDTFTRQIYNNYNISIISKEPSESSARLEVTENNEPSYLWEFSAINNSDAVLQYRLTPKPNFPITSSSSLYSIDYEADYKIAEAVVEIGEDSYHNDYAHHFEISESTYSYTSSPTIKFIDPNTIDNPKTGVFNIVLTLLAFSGFGIGTYIYTKKKRKFI